MLSGLLHRWSVASRIIAALGGGYVLTSLLATACACLLAVFGMNKAEAVLATTIASFPLYAVIAMAVFHARTATRAWCGLVIASIPAAAFTAFNDAAALWPS